MDQFLKIIFVSLKQHKGILFMLKYQFKFHLKAFFITFMKCHPALAVSHTVPFAGNNYIWLHGMMSHIVNDDQRSSQSHNVHHGRGD